MAFKRSKFKIDYSKKGKNKRTYEGKEFASLMELRFYKDYLKPLQEKGMVDSIIIQPKYVLQPSFKKYGKTIQQITLIGDYEVKYSDGRIITYDVKGLPTQESKIKRKMFDFKFPEKTLIWITLSFGEWIEYDQLQKDRAKRKREKKKE